MDIEEIKDNANKSIRYRVIKEVNSGIFKEDIGKEKYDEIIAKLSDLQFWSDVSNSKKKKYYFYHKILERPSSETYYEKIREFNYYPNRDLSVENYDRIPIHDEDMIGLVKYHNEVEYEELLFTYNSINEIIKVICCKNDNYTVSVEYYLSNEHISFSNELFLKTCVINLLEILGILENAF